MELLTLGTRQNDTTSASGNEASVPLYRFFGLQPSLVHLTMVPPTVARKMTTSGTIVLMRSQQRKLEPALEMGEHSDGSTSAPQSIFAHLNTLSTQSV